jgi:hypothetical protein
MLVTSTLVDGCRYDCRQATYWAVNPSYLRFFENRVLHVMGQEIKGFELPCILRE